MSIGLKVVPAAAAFGALALLVSPWAARAQDQCSTPADQQQCSIECCGRTACSPSCQSDCVRACIDACRVPLKQLTYQAQIADLRARCGYRTGPARVQPQQR